ncbi:signal peptidase I [Halobacteriales archaeon Cl-PHB]
MSEDERLPDAGTDEPGLPDESEGAGGDGGRLVRRATLRRGLGIVALLVFLAVVLPFVVYAVPQVVGAEHSYVVLSGSMEPALSPGDVIVVDDVPAEAIERGDVITFTRPGESRTTTHRVVEVVERNGDPAFITKGDNNEDPDPGAVRAANLQGELHSIAGASLVFPLAGYVIQFASTQTGFTLLFGVPLVLLVLNEIWNVVAAASVADDEGTTTDAGATPEKEAEGDGPPVATDPANEGADRPPDSAAASTGSGISFQAGEIRLALVVLAAFLAYSGAVAVLNPGVWTIGVAASVGVAFGLLGGLYLQGKLGSDESADLTPHDRDDGGADPLDDAATEVSDD